LGNLDEAIEYQNKALEMDKQLNDPYFVSGVYHSIGKIYSKKKDYDKALDYFHQTMAISEKKGFLGTSGEAHRDFGEAYLGKGNVAEAKMHLNKAIEIFEKLENVAEIERIKEIINTVEMTD
jgi:tetratricopeptide (TPR) repeat protein